MPSSRHAEPPAAGTRSTCAAVVVAYRSAATLRACLSALCTDPAVTEVVVVDNSGEAAVARVMAGVAADHPGTALEYVDPGTNTGFARGCNLGVARTSAPVIALVNPDVHLQRTLASLVDLAVLREGDVVAGCLTDDQGVTNVRADASARLEV